MRQDILQELSQRAIDQRVTPGGVIGIVRKNGERTILPFGRFTYEADSSVVTTESVYDLASVTKSIPTASLALMLIDQDRLRIEDQLIQYLPEFSNSQREEVLIKHLLTYTVERYALSQYKLLSAEALKNLIMSRDFESKPGLAFNYTNLPAYLLGLVIEKMLGMPLDAAAEHYFFQPLGMKSTTFRPQTLDITRIAPTEIDEWRGLVQGVPHDESAYVFYQSGLAVGHAGLFSTADDLLTFLEMLLHKGSFKGKAYLSPEIIAEMQTNQIPGLNERFGLGWALGQPLFMGKYCSPHTLGKTGFTGTLVVCDIEKEVAYTLLTNRTFPKRAADTKAINGFRAAVGEVILT